jgi:hypothetical protein
MPNDYSQISALTDRISFLERENKKAKFVRVVPWLILASVFAMGQSRPIPRIIEVREIVVKDDAGQVRIRLNPKGIDVFDAHGNLTTISGGMVAVFLKKEGKAPASVLTASMLRFMDGMTPISQFSTDDFALHIQDATKGKALVMIRADNENGTVSVRDTKGFSAILGKTPLRNLGTGADETTSAASLVLFDKDQKVIWQAP